MTLLHKHGGTITAITGIAHETYKGVADWHFIGDIEWQDGTKSRGRPIPPYCLCYETPEQKAEIERLMGLMNAYLETQGEWHDQKSKRDGRVYSWTPKAPTGHAPAAA
jgi:hypothetical protein